MGVEKPRKIIVVKIPRKGAIPDVPINFPPFDNLHLELIENKDKLKKGLPLDPPKKPRKVIPLPQPAAVAPPPQQPDVREEFSQPVQKKPPSPPSEDDELLAELGDDEEMIIEEDDDEEDEEDIEEDDEEEYDPYAGLSPEEREAKEKEEYLWKWYTIRKKYKNVIINSGMELPNFTPLSDLEDMKTQYTMTVKKLELDGAVDQYKSWIVMGWMGIEFASTQFLNIDMSGFTQQQMSMMHKYDKLLVELGEKEYSSFGSSLPVEVRLLGMILFQAGIFFVGKTIEQRNGSAAANIFAGLTGQPMSSAKSENDTPEPKRRMRGPRIRPEDIERMKS